MLSALYIPRTSLIHSTPFLVKLFILTITVTVAYTVPIIWIKPLLLTLAVLGYVLARISIIKIIIALRAVFVISLFIIGVKVLTEGVLSAMLYAAGLYGAVALAYLLTLTTPTSVILYNFERITAPLSFLGIPHKEIALMLSLIFRFIPAILHEYYMFSDSARLRGKKRASFFFVLPLLIRIYNYAENIVQSLYSRGSGR